nr:MAG: RNA-dependent RNA polymerase [Riboviria sp.]
MRSLSLSVRNGDRLSTSLASALDIESGGEIDPHLLDVSREFAFSSKTAEEFYQWYLRSECFSKYLSDGSAEERSSLALRKFWDAEQECHSINGRLVDPWSRASITQRDWKRARAIVGDILGKFDFNELPQSCAFGPGASTQWKSREAFHQNKWALSTHITEEALPYGEAFLKWSGLSWLEREFILVPGNRVTTVPKRYDVDRTIAIEPDWNMFLQKGVGRMIRRRLRRFGLLHPDAQDKHRALARLGSWTNSLATIDIRSASDLVSLGLVDALLPDDWKAVLYGLRSKVGVCPDGTSVTYGKISSMGNGYTFELETLLFYALACAVRGKGERWRVSVYGDDIICPAETAPALVELLAEAGFATNTSKSFIDGPFRESCGGHYWHGTDVTPFYLRKPPATQGDAIVLGNHLLSAASRDAELAIRLSGPYRLVKGLVQKSLRGPYGLDGVLWSDWDQCVPSWNADTQSYRQYRYAEVTRRRDFSTYGGLAHALWVGTEDNEASWGSVPRSVGRLQKVYVDRDSWSLLPVRLA